MKKTNPQYQNWLKAHHKWKNTPKGKASLQTTYLKRRRRKLLQRYNLSPTDYANMLVAQNQVCAACNRPESRLYKGRIRHLSVDHCHQTNIVRGLLCYGCNSALGFLDDNREYVEMLLRYISKTQ